MKYLVFATLLITSLGAAGKFNKMTTRAADELVPLYYCDRCGALVADLDRHLSSCTGSDES